MRKPPNKPLKKNFFEEYRKPIIIGFILAFVAAFGGWTFSTVKNSVAALDDKYDNSVLQKVVPTKEDLSNEVKSLFKKIEDGDQVVAQQVIKTFDVYQKKIEIQTLEDLRRQKVLIEKELGRDSKNQYLRDQLDSLKRQIQMLEDRLYK